MLLDAEDRQSEDLERKSQAGAVWFYWIGGLSLFNSVTQALGNDRAFLVGLGVTQVIDALAAGIAEGMDGTAGTALRGIGFALDVVAASLFLLLGWEARDRKRWAFVLGMVLYALDGLVFLLVGEWLGLALHALVLYWIGRGFVSSARARSATGIEPV